MTTSRSPRLLISRPDQREALTSTVRMELIETLCAAGPSTVAALAARMGRTPHSLYHHVRRLLDAALIRQVDTRRNGAREQAVYDVVADVFEIAEGAGDAALDEADRKMVGVILRKTEREFRAALEADPAELRSGEFYTARMRTAISRRAHREILAHVHAIEKIFTRERNRDHGPGAKLRRCSMTIAFVPSPSAHDD